MEPTIYKPSIYKGTGIYKTGAGGGGPIFGNTVIGGRIYKTIKIETQIWLSENLDYKPSGIVVGSNAFYYDNDELNYGIDGTYKCGLLYDFNAVNILLNGDFFPDGFRIPNDTDFQTLFSVLSGGYLSAVEVKAKDNSIVAGYPSGWNGLDSTHMSITPCGGRKADGSYYSFGARVGLWLDNGRKYLAVSSSINNSLNILSESDNNWCNSIRLVKDA